MILQYASDLHLELRKSRTIPIIDPIKEGESYLALCGDIGNPFISTYKEFLDIHSKLFVHILIVSGNHEYYTSNKKQRTIVQSEDKIKEIVMNYDNVTYLNMNKIIIGRTKFLGCTLWSDVSEIETIAENIMNDYNHIFIPTENSDQHWEYKHNMYGNTRKKINKIQQTTFESI